MTYLTNRLKNYFKVYVYYWKIKPVKQEQELDDGRDDDGRRC